MSMEALSTSNATATAKTNETTRGSVLASGAASSSAQQEEAEADDNERLINPQQQQQQQQEIAEIILKKEEEKDELESEQQPPSTAQTIIGTQEPIMDRPITTTTTTTRALCPWWTHCTDALRRAILWFVQTLSGLAARNPWTVVVGIPVLSLLLVGTGLLTNFEFTMDPETFLIPTNTKVTNDYHWMMSQVGFAGDKKTSVSILVHAHGNNVLTHDTTRKTVQVMELVMQETPGYDDVCSFFQQNNDNQDDTTTSHNNNNNTANHQGAVWDESDTLDFPYYRPMCFVYSVTRFWNHNVTQFDLTVQNDQDVMDTISSSFFLDTMTPVAHEALLGNYERRNGSRIITYAESYIMNLAFPDAPGVAEMEEHMVNNLKRLRDEWEAEEAAKQPEGSNTTTTTTTTSTSRVALEFVTPYSLEQEVTRAVLADAWLIPLVVIIMSNFTVCVFFRKHKVKSRFLLGYGAVLTVAFSLMTGFGIMFITGVPATSILPILPYIVFGIAMDDTFIITGAYFRTIELNLVQDDTENGDPACEREDDIIVRRMRYTMDDIGVSITLTTTTTMIAFLLSTFSTIPAIQWLGWYACCTIFVDFIYQITYFVALLVLDERRIRDNRRDVCVWIIVDDEAPVARDAFADQSKTEELRRVSSEDCEGKSIPQLVTQVHEGGNNSTPVLQEAEDHVSQNHDMSASPTKSSEASAIANEDVSDTPPQRQLNFSERAMLWYTQNLLFNPSFQVFIIVVFLGYFAACCYSTTLLQQEWRIQDFVRDDSFITTFIDSLNSYVSFTTLSAVYFRHVNQSEPAIQEQMRTYYSDMSTMDHTSGGEPFPFCWVNDVPAIQKLFGLDETNLTFTEKLDALLGIPSFNEVYGNDFVLHPQTGDIVASRCWFFLTNVDFDDVQDQLDYYHDQLEVTHSQPINDGLAEKDWPFFSFEYIYFVWQYYDAIKSELIFSTISGVVALSLIGFVLMPHWSASFYLVPLIVMLYMDVMGTIQFIGLHIDSMTFGCIIVSVGLLVDFLMHVLLRYYEVPGRTRQEKTQTTLTTMGASIFIGGLSTFLAILPLALGTSMVMRTVFLCLSSCVFLGLLHGLVFLPVVLSLTGPINHRAAVL